MSNIPIPSRVTLVPNIFLSPKLTTPTKPLNYPTSASTMPSRSNPNVPTSVKNRNRSRKAGLKAAKGPRPTVARTDPGQPVTKSGSGVHRKKTASSKAVRRNEKRSYYAVKRKEAAEEEVRKAGEGGVVEMTGLWTQFNQF